MAICIYCRCARDSEGHLVPQERINLAIMDNKIYIDAKPLDGVTLTPQIKKVLDNLNEALKNQPHDENSCDDLNLTRLGGMRQLKKEIDLAFPHHNLDDFFCDLFLKLL